jgi:hypothetical protein
LSACFEDSYQQLSEEDVDKTDFKVMVLWVMVAIVGDVEQYAEGRPLEDV